jgi:hypothetical protein
MPLARFDPPAFLQDFATEQQKERWSKVVSQFFTDGVGFNAQYVDGQSQFYHPIKTETAEPHEEPLIDWPAFPKLVKSAFPTDPRKAYERAEKGPGARRRYQDEYLEWHVVRNAQGKITRVSFTCETTQYFQILAETDQQKLLSIYKDIVDPAFRDQVTMQDLVEGRAYLPENRWNTDHGAVHLIQPNNSLYAEVMIAAQACILRKREDGTPITDANELIECALYGAPGRASDPRIGAVVNEKARDGYSISLQNPVALYMTRWSSQGWKKPDGSPVGDYWTLLRGRPAPSPTKPAMGLHLVYEVPAAAGFVVGDILIANKPIEYGGQIAENINVGLFGLLCRQGQSHCPSFTCGAIPPSAIFESELEDAPPLRGEKVSD